MCVRSRGHDFSNNLKGKWLLEGVMKKREVFVNLNFCKALIRERAFIRGLSIFQAQI